MDGEKSDAKSSVSCCRQAGPDCNDLHHSSGEVLSIDAMKLMVKFCPEDILHPGRKLVVPMGTSKTISPLLLEPSRTFPAWNGS